MKLNYTDYSLFDECKITKFPSPIGEYTRLVDGLKPKPGKTVIDSITGQRIDIPPKRGILIEECSFNEAINYLADRRIKKSNSQIGLIHDILAVRFPTEYAQNREKIINRDKLEYEMTQSNAKNDPAYFGMRGFSGTVRQDGSLRSSGKQIKLRNGSIKIKRY